MKRIALVIIVTAVVAVAIALVNRDPPRNQSMAREDMAGTSGHEQQRTPDEENKEGGQFPRQGGTAGAPADASTAVPGREFSQTELDAEIELLRMDTIREVQEWYALLFHHLELSDAEKLALSDFLVEDWMRRTRMRNYHPEQIGEQERLDRIAAAIGEDKRDRFLRLELNLPEYMETGRVGTLLRDNHVPLTASQQDGLLKIFVQIRDREIVVPDTNVDAGGIEALENRLASMDEYERLVLELAPSVLSTQQVEHMFRRYQALSYKRAEVLEMHKRPRADGSAGEDDPLWYPPRR